LPRAGLLSALMVLLAFGVAARLNILSHARTVEWTAARINARPAYFVLAQADGYPMGRVDPDEVGEAPEEGEPPVVPPAAPKIPAVTDGGASNIGYAAIAAAVFTGFVSMVDKIGALFLKWSDSRNVQQLAVLDRQAAREGNATKLDKFIADISAKMEAIDGELMALRLHISQTNRALKEFDDPAAGQIQFVAPVSSQFLDRRIRPSDSDTAPLPQNPNSQPQIEGPK
jgi:hypothetical protein